jgi:hypothetical protein
MERYDKLSEDIEAMKEQCAAKLEEEKATHELQMRDFEQRASRMEQKFRHQVRDRLSKAMRPLQVDWSNLLIRRVSRLCVSLAD